MEKIDQILELVKSQDERMSRLEQIEKAREIEGSLDMGGDKETESQMFYVGRDHRDTTGEFDGLFTKTRYDSNKDVEITNEPFITRLYANLPGRTRYGGCSIFVPMEDFERGSDNVDELAGFEVFPGVIEWEGRECVEIFVDINSSRARMNLKGRFASLGGKARVEKIHDNAAGMNGQGYIDRHVPAPDLLIPDYKSKPVSKGNAAVVGELMFEEGGGEQVNG